MSETVANAAVPLADREAVPLVSVKEEQEGLPLRDTSSGASVKGQHHRSESAVSKGGVSTSDKNGTGVGHDDHDDDDDDGSSISDLSLYEDLLDDTKPYLYEPGGHLKTPCKTCLHH